MRRWLRASRGSEYVRPKAVVPAMRNGCSSSGRAVKPSPRTISCPTCPKPSRSKSWWPPSRCAGVSSATTSNSNKNSALAITRGATGGAFIITRACASQPTAFSCWNDSRGVNPPARLQAPALPETFRPRGARPDAAPHPVVDRHRALSPGSRHRTRAPAMPVLRETVPAASSA